MPIPQQEVLLAPPGFPQRHLGLETALAQAPPIASQVQVVHLNQEGDETKQHGGRNAADHQSPPYLPLEWMRAIGLHEADGVSTGGTQDWSYD